MRAEIEQQIKQLEQQIAGALSLGCEEGVQYLREKLERLKAVETTTVYERICIDCGWTGSESELHFLDGWNVCPECHQAEFLMTGEELDGEPWDELVPFVI